MVAREVALSIVVAAQGAYVGLIFTSHVGEADGLTRRLLTAGVLFAFRALKPPFVKPEDST